MRVPGSKKLVAVLGIALGTAAFYSCKSTPAVSATCSINSDCDSPLICAFGRCHSACAATSDCPAGETCLVSGTTGVCQLPQESACTSSSSCPAMQVCSSGDGIQGQQCRSSCTTSTGCFKGQQCLPQGGGQSACIDTTATTDGGADGGGTTTDGSVPDGGGHPKDGSSPADSTLGDSGQGPDGNPCVDPQLTFGFTGQGDTNPHFTGAVGARSTNALFIFSSYVGPDPYGDGGGPPTFGTMFAQAFNPSTGASLGPSTPIVPTISVGGGSSVFGAAIAPTGQIVVLSELVGTTSGLTASFLTPSSDAGVGLGGGVGLQLVRQVVLSTNFVGPNTQPQVIWSNASASFVVSYETNVNGLGYHIEIAEYTVDGAATAGGALVPTDSVGGSTEDLRPSAGVSGNLVGVPFLSTLSTPIGYPGLTALNLQGAQVGSSVYIANAAVESPTSSTAIAVAGTPQGFVAAYSEPSATFVTFIPTSSSGIVSDGGAFPTMTLAGGATNGQGLLAVGDDVGTGGAKGVGVALNYNSGLSFAYVSADGSQVSGPISVLSNPGADTFSMTNYNGSMVLTVYGQDSYSAQIAASGCQ